MFPACSMVLIVSVVFQLFLLRIQFTEIIYRTNIYIACIIAFWCNGWFSHWDTDAKHLILNPHQEPQRRLSIGGSSVSGAEALAEAPSDTEWRWDGNKDSRERGERGQTGRHLPPRLSLREKLSHYFSLSLQPAQPQGTVELGSQSGSWQQVITALCQ